MKLWLALLVACLAACAGYRDTVTPAGVPNFHVVLAPQPGIAGMYRTGLPPTQAAWDELRKLIEETGRPTTRVYLHDPAEARTAADPTGTERPAARFTWNVIDRRMPPEDDRPLTVLDKPDPQWVQGTVDLIVLAHARGETTVWGCVHDRDRGSLISALVGRILFGWTKEQAWAYMIASGLRWELAGLDAYWIEDVGARRAHLGLSRAPTIEVSP